LKSLLIIKRNEGKNSTGIVWQKDKRYGIFEGEVNPN